MKNELFLFTRILRTTQIYPLNAIYRNESFWNQLFMTKGIQYLRACNQMA